MQILGNIWKDGKFWVVECPTLDVSTQSETKNSAFQMMTDLVQTMVNDRKYSVSIKTAGKDGFSMTFKNPTPIIAAIIARSRSASKATLAEIAKAIGSKSPNSIYQYETGKHDPGMEKLNQLLNAMGFEIVISVIKPDKPPRVA
jgi:predicted RNase H-like HicB family nuclease